MSGRASKCDSYWLRERNKKQTDVEKNKSKELHAIDYPNKHKNNFKNFSFVEKCSENAKQMKNMENANLYSKTSKDLFYPSVFRNFLILFKKKMKKYIITIKSIDFVLKK